MKVLIADDDRLIRTMVRDLLAELGHAAVEASNGTEAVAVCEREAPDVLILDLLMPRLSGLDALHALRAKGIRAPAVLLSAISGRSVRGLDGAEAVEVLLEKPVTRQGLARALERALRGAGAPPPGPRSAPSPAPLRPLPSPAPRGDGGPGTSGAMEVRGQAGRWRSGDKP